MKAITKLFLVIFAVITCLGCEKIENNKNRESFNTAPVFYLDDID